MGWRVLLLALGVWGAAVRAEPWREVSLGGIDFQIAADWRFFFDTAAQAGGFSPDPAAFAEGRGAAVAVVRGPLAPALPGATTVPGPGSGLAGLAAVEVVASEPIHPGLDTRIFDLTLPGATPTLMLIAPHGQWEAHAQVFGQVIATARAHPGPLPPVPDPSGTWYRNGREDSPIEVRARDMGIAFDVSAPGLATELSRLDATTLQILSEGVPVTGRLDPDGQEVRWADGGVWLRRSGGLVVPAEDGAPMSPAGVSVPMDLGIVRIWVPASWPQTRDVDRLGRAFVRATDPAGEASAHLVVIPATPDAALWRDLADAVTAGLAATEVAPQAPWAWARDAEGIINLPAGDRPARLHLRAAPVSDGLAVLLVTWAVDGNPVTADDAAMISAMSNLREAPPPAADPSAALAAVPPPPPGAAPAPPPPEVGPAPPPPAALPPSAPPVADARVGGAPDAHEATSEVLFDGDGLAGWQVLGDFARVGGGLRVEVPAGNGWAKSGLWSDRRLVAFRDGRSAMRLTFLLDPAATTDFVVSLDHTAGPEEWDTHELRLHWTRLSGEASHVALFHRQALVAETDVPGPAPDRLSLHLDPSGVVRLDLPQGPALEARLPPPPPEGWFVHAVTAAREPDAPARLGLRRIELAHGVPPALAVPPWPSDPAGEVALIDGTMGRVWAPLALAGGDFRRDARLDAQGLRVAVAPGLGEATAGLFTPDPVLWLEDFGPGAEAVATFALDPAGTGGFLIALTPTGTGGPAAEAPDPSLTLTFLPDPAAGTGRAALRLSPDVPGEAWAASGPAAAPSEVTLRITPGAVTVAAEGFPSATLPWSQAVEGIGLRLHVYPVSSAPDEGNRLALRQVTLRRSPGAAVTQGPAPGVEPLPVATLFDGDDLTAWEPVGYAGGDFAAFARLADGALRIEVPPGNSWGATGLLSAAPVLRLDRRHATAPARLVLQLDPAPETSAVVVLSATRAPDLWFDHVAWIALGRRPNGGNWTLTLHHASGRQWTREIAPDAMDLWDGRLIVEAGPGWVAAGLGGGPEVRGQVPMVEGLPVHAEILAMAPAEGHAARLILRRIETGMATPPGMTAADRWLLVEDDAFRPDAFLSDLGAELEGTP